MRTKEIIVPSAFSPWESTGMDPPGGHPKSDEAHVGKTQHRFNKGKYYLTNMIACYDKVALLADARRQWRLSSWISPRVLIGFPSAWHKVSCRVASPESWVILKEPFTGGPEDLGEQCWSTQQGVIVKDKINMPAEVDTVVRESDLNSCKELGISYDSSWRKSKQLLLLF